MALLIKNGRIYTMENRVYERGYILCENGIISDVGDMSDCPWLDCETCSLSGEYVLPGLIDAHTHSGLFADSMPFEIKNSGVSRPDFKACDMADTNERAFSDALRHGITTVVVSPCSDAPSTGQLAVFRTHGENKLLRALAGFKFSLGENPVVSDNYNSAEDEIRSLISSGGDAFLPLIRREVPAVFHCHSECDIRTAIKISEDFNLRYILVHATDSDMLSNELASKRADIITGPILTTRSKKELKNFSERQFANLVKIGLSPAICTDYPETPAERLMTCAALAASHGTDDISAFSAVTISPARMFGLSDTIGSIRKGKSCDLAIYSGHPFDMRSQIKHVFSSGEMILA